MFAGRQVKFFSLAGRRDIRKSGAENEPFFAFAVVNRLKAERIAAQ